MDLYQLPNKFHMKSVKSVLLNSLTILSAIAILCWLAIYNNYPLTFNYDTAMYLETAHYGVVGKDRPIIYGLFMMFVSGGYSTWLIVLTQAFIVSLTFFYCFKYFTPTRFHDTPKHRIVYLLFIALISFCMGASFNVSWLMADVFTPISILTIAIFLIAEKIKLFDKIILSIIMIMSLGMHNSNLFLCLGLCICMSIYLVLKKINGGWVSEKYKPANYGVTFNKIFVVSCLILVSHLTISTIHYKYKGGFKSSRGGAMFFAANLVEMGVMDAYISENCGVKKYSLCKFRDTVPNNFLWSDKSPFQLAGGFSNQNEEEYNAIVKDILFTPRYLKVVIFKSFFLTCKQFFYFNTGEAEIPGDRISTSIFKYYNNEYQRYIDARQNSGRLDFTSLNNRQVIVFAICLLIYIVAFIKKNMTPKYRMLFFFILMALLINAWICGTLSGVYPRYQSRVVWLLPLPLFIYIAEHISIKKIYYIFFFKKSP
jgi:hypothetical protein